MHRWLRETFVLIGAPAALALAVLVAGTAIAQTPAATELPELWPVSECHTATVVGLANASESGSALLCMADDVVRPAAYLSSLTPESTYGVWLLAADRMSDCRSTRCSFDAHVETMYPGVFRTTRRGVCWRGWYCALPWPHGRVVSGKRGGRDTARDEPDSKRNRAGDQTCQRQRGIGRRRGGLQATVSEAPPRPLHHASLGVHWTPALRAHGAPFPHGIAMERGRSSEVAGSLPLSTAVGRRSGGRGLPF
jgi:hypothetical protein